jgi:hypothetical protein
MAAVGQPFAEVIEEDFAAAPGTGAAADEEDFHLAKKLTTGL